MSRMSHTHYTVGAAALYCLGSLGGAQASSCTFSGNVINCQMTNGARWEMSWASDTKKGLVLNQITLTPKASGTRTLILNQAALAEVLVTYDDATPKLNHLSATGLPLTTLTNQDCPLPGALRQDGSGNSVVCVVVLPHGYSWRGGFVDTTTTPTQTPAQQQAELNKQLQGDSVVVLGASAVAGDTYIHQWVFSDDGSIQPMIGVSGQLDPVRDSTSSTSWPIGPVGATHFATNHFHTAYWRLDFALGDPANPTTAQSNDLVQQLDHDATVTATTRNQTITDIKTEGKFTIVPDQQRFWLIKDTVISRASNGQKIAFQMVPHHTSVQRSGDTLTAFDVYVTQNKACEQLANNNPTTSGCAADLPGFVNNETITDPVFWIGSTWHQVPRAEDEAARLVHWQGVVLAPRDISETSPFN